MFDLAELPLTLPSYVEHVPRVTLENSSQLLRVNQIKDFEHLVRLKLKCSNSNFRLPPGLRELVWRESSICRFFCDFSILARLSQLDLSYNQLTSVPFLPQCLQVFKINHNQLQELTFECPMPHLRAIHASHNRIKSISDSISSFANLQSLRLNDNMIYKLPNFDQTTTLIELDIRNNRLQKLPHVTSSLVTFELDGNYSNSTGPFLGNEFLKKGPQKNSTSSNEISFDNFKFNRKPDGKEVITTSTSNTGLESETTKSTQIVKSDTTSSLISDTTVQNNRVHVRRQALKNFVESQKENFSLKKEETILNLVRSILRKDLLETEEEDLRDGILFIRCYNLKRNKSQPSIIVELLAPREQVLSANKSRRNAEKFADAAVREGYQLEPEDVLKLNEEKLCAFLRYLAKN